MTPEIMDFLVGMLFLGIILGSFGLVGVIGYLIDKHNGVV